MNNTPKLLAFVVLGIVGALLPGMLQAQNRTSESYADVMVVVNTRSYASLIIGNDFANRRGIPDWHICHIDVDSSESIDSVGFLAIRWKMQAWMRQHNLVDSIAYIVTTKGCPLRVRTQQWDAANNGQLVAIGGQASFEDCIALMNDRDSSLATAVKTDWPINPYYRETRHWTRNPDDWPMYLVTRLDAYTVDQVLGIIRKAENPAFLGEGLWVLDADPTKEGSPGYKVGNDWLVGADSILRGRGMNVMFNRDSAYLRNNTGVIGYASWGSNDAYSGGREGAVPHNTWLNGALAETYVSTGGRTFNSGTTGGQSLIADWIAEGATGVKGYTDEPYLHAIANPNILFDRYTSGYNLAESFWAASILRAWRQVVIGDPKLKLAMMISSDVNFVDFASHPRYSLTRDTILIKNNSDAPVDITALRTSGSNADEFSAALVSGIFPAAIAGRGTLPIVVAFRPTGYDGRSATLLVEYKRPSDPRTSIITIPLEGQAMRPQLQVPTSYDFGAVTMGETARHTIEIASLTPSDTVTITRIDKTGTGASKFEMVPSPSIPTDLVGTEPLRLDIGFSPSNARRDSMTINVYHTIPGAPVIRIKVYGTGAVSAAPAEPEIAGFHVSASPNPFVDRAELRFNLAVSAVVRVELIDMLGNTIGLLADRRFDAGNNILPLEGQDLASGTYLCRFTIGARSFIQPIIRK